MLGLASLSLGDAKAYESISEVFLRRVTCPHRTSSNKRNQIAGIFHILGGIHSAALANHDDANLARMLHFVFDLLGDIMSENRGLSIGYLVRVHHDELNLATSLHRIGALDTGIEWAFSSSFSRRLM